MPAATEMRAVVDFVCLESDCGHTVAFNLLDLKQAAGQVGCAHCHRLYQFDDAFVVKLEKLRTLVLAVRDAEDILGDCNVSITTTTDAIKLPYRLLLTRLNTMISLTIGDEIVDFNFRIEPLSDATFK